jgi:hypothetical protein
MKSNIIIFCVLILSSCLLQNCNKSNDLTTPVPRTSGNHFVRPTSLNSHNVLGSPNSFQSGSVCDLVSTQSWNSYSGSNAPTYNITYLGYHQPDSILISNQKGLKYYYDSNGNVEKIGYITPYYWTFLKKCGKNKNLAVFRRHE